MRNAISKPKSAEMSLTVVIGAILALVVLIVLIYIFTKQSQKASGTFGSCQINGGVCQSSCSGLAFPIKGDCPNSQQCCADTNILCDKDSTGKCCPTGQVSDGKGNCVASK